MSNTLLLADDSVVIQKLVGLSFANEEIQLVTTDNGDDALLRAREIRPDLILADVVMPGKNGYEVCEAIKNDPGLQHIPVLLLTGTFEAFDEERARLVQSDGHITKPFEAKGLVDRVTSLLERAAAAPAAASAPSASETDTATSHAATLPGANAVPEASVATASPDDSFDFFDDDVKELAEPTRAKSPAPAATTDDFEFGSSELEPLAGLGEPDALDASFDLDADTDPAGDLTIAVMPDAAGQPAAMSPPAPDALDATRIAFSDTTPPPAPAFSPNESSPRLETTADAAPQASPTPIQAPLPDPAPPAAPAMPTSAPSPVPSPATAAPQPLVSPTPMPPPAVDATPMPPPPTHSSEPMQGDPGATIVADDLFPDPLAADDLAGAPGDTYDPLASSSPPSSPPFAPAELEAPSAVPLPRPTASPGEPMTAVPAAPLAATELSHPSAALVEEPASPPVAEPLPEVTPIEDPALPGAVAVADLDADLASEFGAEFGAARGAGMGPDLGSSFDSELDSGLYAGSGPEPLADSGLDLLANSGSDLLANSGSDLDSGFGANAGDLQPFAAVAPDLEPPAPVAQTTTEVSSLSPAPPTPRAADTEFAAPSGDDYDVSVSDLGDPFAHPSPKAAMTDELGPMPTSNSNPLHDRTSAPDPGSMPDLSPMMRDRIHETLEKVAWEAFSDVSDTIVRQVLKRVEAVVWEVVPQMAETLIQEEIRRMKGED